MPDTASATPAAQAPAATPTQAQAAQPATPATAPAAAIPPALAAMLPQQATTSAQPGAAVPAALAAMLPPAAPAQSTPAAQPAAQAPAQGTPAAQPAAQAPAQGTPAAQDRPKQTAEEQVAELRAQLNARNIRDLVVGVARTAGAINEEQVHALVAGELDVAADGRVIVRGDPRADASQHVARFLAGNLHLLRPVVAGGGAGSPSTVQSPGAAQVLSPYSREGGTAHIHSFLGRIFPAPQTPAPTAQPAGVAAPR